MGLSPKEIAKKRGLALKLLALGGNNDNPHEKAAALAKAEAICLQIGITLHQLGSPSFTSYGQWQQTKAKPQYEYKPQQPPKAPKEKTKPTPYAREKIRAMREIDLAYQKHGLSGSASKLKTIVVLASVKSASRLAHELRNMSLPAGYSLAYDCVDDYLECLMNAV